MPSETVTGRFSTGRLARAVSPRLVLAVGARTELSIDRLDELGMAVDMVLAQASGQSVIVLTPEPQHLTVAVQPAADSWVERHRQLLASLVDRVEIVPGGVELRAG